MNNDAPQTLDAAGSRVAELEQQLRLSDEGVSRLAQRCLELEQQVLKYEAVSGSSGSAPGRCVHIFRLYGLKDPPVLIRAVPLNSRSASAIHAPFP